MAIAMLPREIDERCNAYYREREREREREMAAAMNACCWR
jgi:hypothetical protein